MHQNMKNRGSGNTWPSDGVRMPWIVRVSAQKYVTATGSRWCVQSPQTAVIHAKSHSCRGSDESRSKSPGVSWNTWLGIVKHGIAIASTRLKERDASVPRCRRPSSTIPTAPAKNSTSSR